MQKAANEEIVIGEEPIKARKLSKLSKKCWYRVFVYIFLSNMHRKALPRLAVL